MAVHESCRSITGIAGSAIVVCRFVALAADGQYDHVGTAQAFADGVSGETQPTVGRSFPVVVLDAGAPKVEAGATIAVGDLIASDNTGKAIVWVDAVGNECLGKARTAGASGAYIEFLANRQTGAGS